MTRRVLLTVAGATLLSVWTADPVRPGTPDPRTPDPRRGRAGLADSFAPRDRPAPVRRSPEPHAASRPAGTASGQPRLAAARHANPAVAREVADAGHLITNHTWTHLNLAWLPPAAVTEQMSRGTYAIHAATGRVPDLFRAPYGAWSPFVLSQCARTGMVPLGWSVDPRDWSRPGVASIVANIMRNTRTGSIILEHDGGGDRSQTVAALKIVIPRLLAAGYHFPTP
jgi:peptidoglycan-N-acetylglucosamine deacetylase